MNVDWLNPVKTPLVSIGYGLIRQTAFRPPLLNPGLWSLEKKSVVNEKGSEKIF